MQLKDFVDLRLIQQIQDQFSDATGLAAIAVDAQGNYITQASNFTDFCMKYTRGSEEGKRRCAKCDLEGKGTYFCHAGLMDFACEIIVNGEKLGSILGGQVLSAEPDYEQFRITAHQLHVDENAFIDALKKVPIRPEKTIRAASGMLENVINQLVNLEYLKSISQKKIAVFDAEIQSVMNDIHTINSKMRDLKNVASMENILSINASIEAGRAGKAGVGFAVVAKEIGQLSKNSAGVYSEIQDRVASIEKSVKNMHQVGL